MLVDVVANPLLLDSVSESEYPTIYEAAFSMYVVDESCLIPYEVGNSQINCDYDFLMIIRYE